MPTDPSDPTAVFEAWYEREMPRLFNYVAYLVQDQGAAEDLTASICERALRRLGQYDPHKGNLDAWMFAIARNAVKNYFRSIQRSPPAASLEALPDISAAGATPEEAAETAEAFRLITRNLVRLSEQEQEVIALRFGADLPNKAIAQVMGLSTGHVGVLLHRALNRLRAAVGAETPSEEVSSDV